MFFDFRTFLALKWARFHYTEMILLRKDTTPTSPGGVIILMQELTHILNNLLTLCYVITQAIP